MFRKLHEPGPNAVTLTIDGAAVTAEAGESVAAVLLRQSPPWSRTTPVTPKQARALLHDGGLLRLPRRGRRRGLDPDLPHARYVTECASSASSGKRSLGE